MLRGPVRSGPTMPLLSIADRDRLRVAEAVRRRVAAGAGVVVVQAGDRVEPEQPADVRQPRVEWAAEPRGQRRLDPAGESEFLEALHELRVEPPLVAAAEGTRREQDDGREEEARMPSLSPRIPRPTSPLQRVAVRGHRREVDRVAARLERRDCSEHVKSVEKIPWKPLLSLAGPLPASEKLSFMIPENTPGFASVSETLKLLL